MKNKLFYLIGVACILSYTGTFTSCVNGVDDEYLEQKFTDNGGTDKEEGEELPDLNGDYGQGGDYDLLLTCNGEELGGKLISVATDENNKTATFILAGTEVDIETAIATAIPGGVGGLISGMGLKYISNSPIPGEKEISIPNVPLFKNGTAYRFDSELIQPTYTIAFKGIIEDDKMKMDINYDLTNQTLAGTWDLAAKGEIIGRFSPLWTDWDSTVNINLGKVSSFDLNKPFNSIFSLVSGPVSSAVMQQIIGTRISLQTIVKNMLQSVTAEPNGCMFATYSYSGDLTNPQWSSEMSHNILRYYYDAEHPNQKIYLEINADFLIKMIGSLIPSPSTRAADYDKTKEIGKRLIKLLVPILQNGIPCEYVLEENNLTINVDGVALRDILRVLIELLNDEVVKTEVDKVLENLGDFKQNISTMLETMPDALQYADGDKENGFTGECSYVKIGLKLVKK